MERFSWPVRVYWEDTDAQGVVYYANYLRFMERARTEWLRTRGIDQPRLRQDIGLIFSVVKLDIHYKLPARYDDQLAVTADVIEHSRVTFTFEQNIYRDDPDGELLCAGSVFAACLDAESLRPRRLPAELIEEFA